MYANHTNTSITPKQQNDLYENECHESLAAIFDAIAEAQSADSILDSYMPTPIIFVSAAED